MAAGSYADMVTGFVGQILEIAFAWTLFDLSETSVRHYPD